MDVLQTTVWVLSRVLCWVKLLKTSTYRFLCEHKFSLFGEKWDFWVTWYRLFLFLLSKVTISQCMNVQVSLIFFFSHSNKPLVVFHSDFNFNFLNGQGWWPSFYLLICHPYTFIDLVCIQPFCPYFYCVVYFFFDEVLKFFTYPINKSFAI